VDRVDLDSNFLSLVVPLDKLEERVGLEQYIFYYSWYHSRRMVVD
jgi:hypothetical protein